MTGMYYTPQDIVEYIGVQIDAAAGSGGFLNTISKRIKMDTKGMLDTMNTETEKLDTNIEAVTEWLAGIDKTLKSINGKLSFFELVLIIAILVALIRVVFG